MPSKDLTPAPGEITALLGRGTEFRGKLVFEGRVRVDGRLIGEVHGDGMLVVGEGAELEAEVDVSSLLVLAGGTVRGAVRARELVELHAESRVVGDVETPRLFIDKGAHFDGRCRMSDGTPSERLPLADEAAIPAAQSERLPLADEAATPSAPPDASADRPGVAVAPHDEDTDEVVLPERRLAAAGPDLLAAVAAARAARIDIQTDGATPNEERATTQVAAEAEDAPRPERSGD
ncbi:MAG: polymer-forming cytoskeletal protein [Myxococcales bacterium]|nr:polymer-forming cytoskeletal protein [Myxococcales bacterium]